MPRVSEADKLVFEFGAIHVDHGWLSHIHYRFGMPTDANSPRAGTGGPPPNSTFKGCDGQTYKRNSEGGIPDEIGKDHQRITNAPGTLSMANTGRPESGGSQFFINVNHNSFLDWFDRSSPSAHPVFGKVGHNDNLQSKSMVHGERDLVLIVFLPLFIFRLWRTMTL
jgi:hypothetical protein